jgi:hypothetical protein
MRNRVRTNPSHLFVHCAEFAQWRQVKVTARLWQECDFTHFPGGFYSGYGQSLAPLQQNRNGSAWQNKCRNF